MQSVAELNREYEARARSLGYQVDCAADGMFNAQIAIITEAPGEREVTLKVPLVGGSGQLLWNALKKHNITRRDVYVTNVVKKQLSFYGKDDDKVKVNKAEFDNWAALLKWELANLPHLRYVLLLGNYPIEALLSLKGITKWRGSVLDFTIPSLNAASQPRVYQAVATLNPAAVMREPRQEISFVMDVAKLPLVVSGTYKPYTIQGNILTNFKDAMSVLEEIDNVPKPISFDIESGGGETACFGFANDGHVGYTIPFRQYDGGSYFTLEEEVAIRRKVQHLFNPKELRKGAPGTYETTPQEHRFIAQNANFDMYWLWYKDRIRVHRSWLDTMLAHHTLYPTLPHDLGYLTTQYTTHPYYKDERTEWRDKGDINAYWQYNIKDACITWTVAHRLKKELEEQKLDEFFFNHVMRLQPNLVRMTVGGVKVDEEGKGKLSVEIGEEVGRLLVDFHDKVRIARGTDDFRPNPNSPKDLSRLFFQELRLVGRGTKTDATNRRRMLDHPRTSEPAKEVIKALDKYKEQHKFFSTYVESKIDPDGRIRCEWKQTGVQKAPGRLSSAKTLWGSGMNMQNQPPKARGMYIADDDHVLCYFDLTQAEAQFVGWDAGIETWKEQYTRARLGEKGYDAHRALASTLFKIPYDDVPTFDHDDDGKPTIRYKSKRARHGLNYRMAGDRLAETSGMSVGEAIEVYTLYHREHPELRRWWRSLEDEVRRTKMLFNAYGRRLLFLERLNNDEALESIVAFRPQSTIGDKVARVIYMCHEDEEWPHDKARIAMNIHDALIAIAHKDVAKTVLRLMKKHAEEPIIVKGEPLIISAELGISTPDEHGFHRWSTIKKVKNLDELVVLR